MKKISSILFLIVVLISCKNNASNEKINLHKKIGKELIFPKETKVIYSDGVLYDSV